MKLQLHNLKEKYKEKYNNKRKMKPQLNNIKDKFESSSQLQLMNRT